MHVVILYILILFLSPSVGAVMIVFYIVTCPKRAGPGPLGHNDIDGSLRILVFYHVQKGMGR